MSAEIHEVFAAVLRSGRAEFNHRFALAKHQYPSLNAADFNDFLANTVDPWLRAVLVVRPECGPDVVLAGYEAGLSLVGQRLVGAGAQSPAFAGLLQRLLVGCAGVSALAPQRLLFAAGNALHHLTQTPACYPEFWVSELERFAPFLRSFEQWLRVGQVLAWRSGLAHYRASALRSADTLPPELALPAVGAGPELPWPEIRARFERDPWFVPGRPEQGLRVVKEIGAFRGFGGLFAAPPRVLRCAESVLVASEGEAWWLLVDAFGATLQRASSEELRKAVVQKDPPRGLAFARGQLDWQGETLHLPSDSIVSSFAADGRTLVCSFAASHSLAVVALPS